MYMLWPCAQIIGMMERNPLEVEKAFKEAHLLIKRLVVEQTGEMPPNTHWTLTQEVHHTQPGRKGG